MNSPPKLAVWLFRRFANSDEGDAILGDLLEQYRHGRSPAWFWRQTLAGILLALQADFSVHKITMVRGVVFGWIAMWIFSFFTSSLLVTLRNVASAYEWSVIVHVPGLVFTSLMGALAGWIVAKWHPRSTVLLFAASVWLWSVPWFVRVISSMPALPVRQLVTALAFSFAIPFVLIPMSILFGGILRPAE